MNRIFLIITTILLILSLACLVGKTTIAGAAWTTWLVSALLAWSLDQLLSPYIVRRTP